MNVLDEVQAERERQDRKWGGATHDDLHKPEDWVEWIQLRCDEAYAEIGEHHGDVEYRRNMIEIAALAVASVQALDRHAGK